MSREKKYNTKNSLIRSQINRDRWGVSGKFPAEKRQENGREKQTHKLVTGNERFHVISPIFTGKTMREFRFDLSLPLDFVRFERRGREKRKEKKFKRNTKHILHPIFEQILRNRCTMVLRNKRNLPIEKPIRTVPILMDRAILSQEGGDKREPARISLYDPIDGGREKKNSILDPRLGETPYSSNAR